MGTNEKIFFSRNKNTYSPEEISAEILKSLKRDVAGKYPDINLDGVVITIPAYFSTVQAEATKRAGELAGFNSVVLLQEPIAAAIAYGFNNDEDYLKI
jgi:molecular chaperone DnaK